MNTLSTHAPTAFTAWSRSLRLALPTLKWPLGDGEYYPRSVSARLEASVTNAFHPRHSKNMSHAISDVEHELHKALARKRISHIVIYGSNRKAVAARILLDAAIPGEVVVILAQQQLSRELLISRRINHRLSLAQIAKLPASLEAVDSTQHELSSDLVDALYTDHSLVGPYQIDTDRYPFTNCTF